jgi:hypothetical protein
MKSGGIEVKLLIYIRRELLLCQTIRQSRPDSSTRTGYSLAYKNNVQCNHILQRKHKRNSRVNDETNEGQLTIVDEQWKMKVDV